MSIQHTSNKYEYIRTYPHLLSLHITHSCGASDWRRTEHSTLRHCAAAWVRMCGCSAPIARLASGPYVTRSPGVVDRTLSAHPSCRQLTSHLSHSYISTPLSSITLVFPSAGVFSLCPGVLRQRES